MANYDYFKFSRDILEPEVAKELKDFFENQIAIRQSTADEDRNDKVDLFINTLNAELKIFNNLIYEEIGVNVKTITQERNRGKQSNFSVGKNDLKLTNKCSVFVFCLPEITNTEYCKYECYFVSKKDINKCKIIDKGEYFLVPFNVIKKIYKFKFKIDLTNKK